MAQGFAEGVLDYDGSFRFRGAAADVGMRAGDFALVSSRDGSLFLGQVEDCKTEFVLEPHIKTDTLRPSGIDGPAWTDETTEMVPRGQREGSGRVLAGVKESQRGWTAELEAAVRGHTGAVAIQHAPDEAVESFVAGAYAGEKAMLRVGALLGVSTPVPVRLIPDGLKRPTGVFGQPGSGKSFALGIIVEELALQTEANVVVLDPNGDFVRFKDRLREFGEINDGSSICQVTREELDRYRQVHEQKAEARIALLSADPSVAGATPIALRQADLDLDEIAAALRLDPVRDMEEYYLLANAVDAAGGTKEIGYAPEPLRDAIDELVTLAGTDTRNIAASLQRRLRNVRFENLDIWNLGFPGDVPTVEILKHEQVQALLIDLSGLDRLEKTLVSSLVFRTVWDVQQERRRNGVDKCTVLVVDEAHHVFPGTPLFADQGLTAEWGTKIAGEGRKFGVYLLLSSQLPSKIHEHVLTQCGNLVLMRMVSQSDIDALRDSFSFVRETLLERSKWFGKGEALVIGDIVPAPCLLHFEGRKTQEGGRDLKVDWGKPAVVD